MHPHPRQNTSNTGLYGGYKALLATPHRFSFNGMEKDDEVKGEGNSLDFGARLYDPCTGKFLSIDPRWRDFPANSPFCYSVNNPIRLVDVEGEGPGDPIFL